MEYSWMKGIIYKVKGLLLGKMLLGILEGSCAAVARLGGLGLATRLGDVLGVFLGRP